MDTLSVSRPARRRLKALGWIALAGLGMLGSAGSRAQAEAAAGEHAVKAAFLYRFAGYVDWPASAFAGADTPLTIGVVGAEPLRTELQQAVRGRVVADRGVEVRKLAPGEPLARVHIVFLGRAEAARMGQLRPWLQEAPVLVVTEADGALAEGSMINFVVLDRRVRFEIALDAAERQGLRLSSRLLAVAQKVTGGTP